MALVLHVLIVILGMTCPMDAKEASQLLDKANELYQQGSFHEAATCYEELVRICPSANGYYNLGNAYYRQNKIGYAILNYERARRLSPRDPDILHNLAYVRSLVPETARSDLARIFGFFTPRELWIVLVVGYVFLITLVVFAGRRRKPVRIILGILVVLILFGAAGLVHKSKSPPKGVVVSPGVAAYFEPNLLGTVHFTLPEGALVSVQQQREDWCLIKRQDQKRGWILTQYLQLF